MLTGYPGLMKTFSLRSVKLRSGEEFRDAVDLELTPLDSGASARAGPRACTGFARDQSRHHRHALPAPLRARHRPLLPVPRRRRRRHPDQRARVPGDEPRRPTSCDAVPRRGQLDLTRGRATRSRSRCRADLLPAGLQGPLPGLRQGPERRAARAREEATSTRALGRPRGASRQALGAIPGTTLLSRDGRPKEENFQVPPRQAPGDASSRGTAREQVPDLPSAQAAASRVPELQDVQGPRDRAATRPLRNVARDRVG